MIYERGESGKAYNVGARNERENIEVVTAILDALNKPHSLIKYVTDRLGHDRRYAINPEKIEDGNRLEAANDVGRRLAENN